MRINEEKTVTNISKIHVKTRCDKCGINIAPQDEIAWVNYGKYFDDGITSFELCYKCNEELLNKWLINYDYD